MALPSPMRAAAIKMKVVTKSRIVGIIHAPEAKIGKFAA
jgi:hypothetical protein